MNTIDKCCHDSGSFSGSDVRLAMGLIKTKRDIEVERAEAELCRLPGTRLDYIKDTLNKQALKARYNLAMDSLNENHPRIYKALTSVGLPEPYWIKK